MYRINKVSKQSVFSIFEDFERYQFSCHLGGYLRTDRVC